MKQTFETKLQQVQRELKNKQDEAESQKELLEEANNILNMFNDEKHEVKAKFKYLMQLINMPQSDLTLDIPLSSYKGRDDEVDLMECFEEMEKVVLEYKANRENKINELMSDKS